MDTPALQERYPDDFSHCYGCGRLNPHGLHIESRWEGAESVCRFRPRPYHTAVPGYTYGGLIASLIDCHAVGTAAAAAARLSRAAAGDEEGPLPRFLTASLQVDYLRPTPLDAELELRAQVTEATPRKGVVEVTLAANGQVCARGRVVAVRMPEALAEDIRRRGQGGA